MYTTKDKYGQTVWYIKLTCHRKLKIKTSFFILLTCRMSLLLKSSHSTTSLRNAQNLILYIYDPVRSFLILLTTFTYMSLLNCSFVFTETNASKIESHEVSTVIAIFNGKKHNVLYTTALKIYYVIRLFYFHFLPC